MNSPAEVNRYIYTETRLAVDIASATSLSVSSHSEWGYVGGWNFERSEGIRRPNRANPVAAIQAFDLEIWDSAAETLSAAKLYGVRQHPVTLSDDNVDTVDDTNNELDITSHSYLTGDGPVQLTTSDTLPTGLSTGTDYWIRKEGAGTISLYTSVADAVAGTDQVTFSDTGTGTHTVVDRQSNNDPDDDTKRLHWHLYGDLNNGVDISLGAQESYVERINHSPLTLFYAVGATLANSTTVKIRAVPVQTVEW